MWGQAGHQTTGIHIIVGHHMTSDCWMLLNLRWFGAYSLCGCQAGKHFVRAQTRRRCDNPRLNKPNRASQIIGKAAPLNPKLCVLNICPAAFVSSDHVRSLLGCVLFEKMYWIFPGKANSLISMTFYLALGKIGSFPKHMLRSFGKSGMFCAASWSRMTQRQMWMKHNGLNRHRRLFLLFNMATQKNAFYTPSVFSQLFRRGNVSFWLYFLAKIN